MIPLVRLKKDVQFNQELTQFIDVLKGIAASRYHVLERRLKLFDRYFHEVGDVLALADLSRSGHPFVRPASPVVGVVMVTSDGGFLGGLNTQVVNAGLQEAGPAGALTVLGERGAGYLRDLRRGFTSFPGIDDTSRLALALAVRDHIVSQVLQGACGRLVVVYPRPVSFAVQDVTAEVFVPCTAWTPPPREARELLWESPQDAVIEYLVTQWIGFRLDIIFALSRLAELAARVVHLEGSYQELQRRGKQLRLQYFRARHEVIDRSMREIFSAQLLYGKSGSD